MSELSVGALSGLAANSYVIDVASGSSLDVTNATGTLPSAQLPAGSILQVVSATKTDTYTETLPSGGESSNIPGLSVTITPSSATSKIFITCDLVSSTSAGTGQGSMAWLRRDSTDIALGDGSGSRKRVTTSALVNNDQLASSSFSFLDSPATTSATTYYVRLAHASSISRVVFVNRSNQDSDSALYARTVSTITAWEVAA